MNVTFALTYCSVIVPLTIELECSDDLEEHEEELIDEAVEHAMQADGVDLCGSRHAEVELI